MVTCDHCDLLSQDINTVGKATIKGGICRIATLKGKFADNILEAIDKIGT